MPLRFLLLVFALTTSRLLAEPVPAPRSDTAKPPNIILILADDLGITDINAYAARFTGQAKEKMYYQTPNLDRLISEGMAFSQAYACPLCSPTRASILTGKDAARVGFTTATPGSVRSYHGLGQDPPAGYLAQDARNWSDPLGNPQALLNGTTLLALPSGQPGDQGRDETTIAEALTGYRSAFIGKWHLGGHGSQGYQPRDQGFESPAYFDAGGSPYTGWRSLWNRRTKTFPQMRQEELLMGDAGIESGETYLTDDLTVRAESFIRTHHSLHPEQPFFLYLCHFAVHSPFAAKQKDISTFEKSPNRGWNGQHDPVYAAMLKSLDDSIGRILQTIDGLGLGSNTLLVFMSDNGGVSYVTKKGDKPVTSTAPFKGSKAMLFEGGIRVPLIARWIGSISPGQWSEIPVAATDLMPTFAQTAGLDAANMGHRLGWDGRSFFPLFKDPQNKSRAYTRDTFYWHYPFNVAPLHPDDGLPLTPHSAIRKGDLKLIFDWHGRLHLHNIPKDPFEKDNLAEARPDDAKALFRELNDWLDTRVERKYTPAINPAYDPEKDPRPKKFRDLRREILGPDRAIRTVAGDARLEAMLRNSRAKNKPQEDR